MAPVDQDAPARDPGAAATSIWSSPRSRRKNGRCDRPSSDTSSASRTRPKRQQEFLELSRGSPGHERALRHAVEALRGSAAGGEPRTGRRGRAVSHSRPGAAAAERGGAEPRSARVSSGSSSSLALAVRLMVAVERLDTAFHSVDDLRRFAAIPVLVSIPRIVTRTDTRRRRWRLALTAVSVVALPRAAPRGRPLFRPWQRRHRPSDDPHMIMRYEEGSPLPPMAPVPEPVRLPVSRAAEPVPIRRATGQLRRAGIVRRRSVPCAPAHRRAHAQGVGPPRAGADESDAGRRQDDDDAEPGRSAGAGDRAPESCSSMPISGVRRSASTSRSARARVAWSTSS